MSDPCSRLHLAQVVLGRGEWKKASGHLNKEKNGLCCKKLSVAYHSQA